MADPMQATHDNALTMRRNWHAVSESRAAFYAWFSTIFAIEMPEDMIAAYLRGEAAPLLSALRKIGLDRELSRLQTSLARWSDVPDLRLELAADFARLFLLGGREAALPYASAYLSSDQQLYGDPHVRMQHFLQNSGLQVHADFKEPSDHLAVYLAAMAQWIRQDAGLDAKDVSQSAADQWTFLNEALLVWLPQFQARCQQIGNETSTDFYPAIAALLLAFLHEDVAYLASVDAKATVAQQGVG